MRLSVIIPTVGRASLRDALSSCAAADEMVVVVDHAGGPVECPVLPENAVLVNVMGGDHGYTARTAGMARATGSHLAFLDDDDVWAPAAAETIRACEADVPVIFRMDDPHHGIIWREPALSFGNVGTPMFVVPNDPANLGVWEAHAPGLPQPGGDFTFIAGCVERMGGPVWREDILAVVAPARRGPSIAVVTPWLDHLELEADYFAAVQPALSGRDEMVIVDDGSTPPLPYGRIRHDKPQGFHAACNAGLALATTDAVLFLNNDIAATRPGWLAPIRAALEPGVLVGAKIRWDRHGDVDNHQLPYLDGWCLAGMRADLDALGGFDETYAEPAYYGDNDLCLRARYAGMTLREVPVWLHHKTGATTDADPARTAVSLANRQRFHQTARELLQVAA